MDKFFGALVVVVFGALILSSVSMFENKSSASTFEQGVNVMLKQTNNRQPAIVSNK